MRKGVMIKRSGSAVEMGAASPYIRVGRSLGEARALDVAKRSVNCSARDFLAAWGRGKAGPVPCAGCSACCYYAGVPVDKKRDRSRLPHLLTERNRDGRLVLQGAQMEPALTWASGAA